MTRKARKKTGGALDGIDRKIVSALLADGRLTINDLAAKVGLSASPCWSRVKRLEASGTINGYTVLVNHEALGLRDVVFVEITLDKHDGDAVENFGSALAAIPEVIEADLVTGEYDYLVKIAVADTHHYERLLRERLYKIKGIRHTKSTFSLRSLKRSVAVDPLELDLRGSIDRV
ncbi:Lrp/AsnC family leucine-responsive transcriptional regulator [Mesorhizobium sp. J18]|uniref:Lrp/AsnC family transcriptional regulator n=1 Tax=Mesorhizobium sp. J18 TaxID=935263 RepID=UPI00119BE612|nr:Lrp/AsnC family transcriptional regulator [Mesorhizobium sp. J18]TWG96400.1 Lrp/AsnC family leucine-responsive transcriptional regulator [Mesorhizobium sp. J18]